GGTLALAACASQPNSTNQKTADQSKTHMVCFSTMPLGSHIAKTQCMSEANYAYYKKAQEEQAKKDRAALDRMQGQGSRTATGDGGGV
ncbi:MAG: hypothetical protein ACRER1_06910, partial [Gammaproteobacteria bacterium]